MEKTNEEMNELATRVAGLLRPEITRIFDLGGIRGVAADSCCEGRCQCNERCGGTCPCNTKCACEGKQASSRCAAFDVLVNLPIDSIRVEDWARIHENLTALEKIRNDSLNRSR